VSTKIKGTSSRQPVQVRLLHTRVGLKEKLPKVAAALHNLFSEKCQPFYIVVEGELPLTVNHSKFKRIRKAKTGTYYAQDVLKPEVFVFRDLVRYATIGRKWEPRGTTAAIILFESPNWLTLKNQVRQVDADNKVKPLLDAIQHATGIEDERHFQLHVFKVCSKKTRTVVLLYDLGDLVEMYE